MANVNENETNYPIETDVLFVDGDVLPPIVASVVAYVLDGNEPTRRRRRGCRGGRKHRGGRRYKRFSLHPVSKHDVYAYVGV